MKLFHVHIWRVMNTSLLLCLSYVRSEMSMALLEKPVTSSNNLHLYVILKFVVGGKKKHISTEYLAAIVGTGFCALLCGAVLMVGIPHRLLGTICTSPRLE